MRAKRPNLSFCRQRYCRVIAELLPKRGFLWPDAAALLYLQKFEEGLGGEIQRQEH